MTKRKIGKTILIYFYSTIILVFLLVAVGFNFAVRNHVKSTLNRELETAKEMVIGFANSPEIPKGPNRRSMFHMMFQRDTVDSSVKVLFLDEDYQLTLNLMDASEPGVNLLDGPHKGMGGMGGMGGRLTVPQGTQPTVTTPHTGSSLDGYFMSLDRSSYEESMRVYEYVSKKTFDLNNQAIQEAQIQGNSYYLQSVPFAVDANRTEYVLAFIGGEVYDGFINNALWILALIMGPVLILTFFLVRYLSRRLAEPIGRLQGLASRLGSGDFKGENLHLQEQELSDLNNSLNEAAEQLKDYHANQKTFFQNVSHELRTPLTGIRGYAEGIKFGVFDKMEAADVILEESEKLEHLVEDILYLSRIESNESLLKEKTKIRLSELLLESREQVANDARIQEKVIEVEVKDDLEISVYYEEMVRALNNLLSNGIRYADSVIRLSGQIQGENIVICVEDDGPGLEPGSEEVVFQRFSKGPRGGHGIGLSIAQAAVERHGGAVRAQNVSPDGGALFIINLPLLQLTD